ncbi:DUF6153 family protein [Sinomonas atrocyanea]|uniref:DUF6153 family protein n=1 Tax=Sinomonas atrocyanea TaxID=37927 RepID=UPI00278495A8|nr:DUF6153 family protein [Sinomonas atrocyanea]MDQ0260172.1 hypothetical protein [Sinomonas atrocyanea]MDR6620234.1 hypothetical protein [Sinomonas atrocyanea]
MQIDTAGAATGVFRRLPGPESWRSARAVLLVAAVMAGLLGMHVLGVDHTMPMPGSSAPTAAAALPAVGHAQHPGAAACNPESPAPAGAMVHCTPAPGVLPPAPPAAVVLGRPDALQRPARAAVPAAVQPRAPTPDLAELSISRT